MDDENLLPDRHPQHDMFICDVADAILKDLIPTMEHPFYALSKKPDLKVRRYENGSKWLEVTPSAKGQATIYDKDILIYVVSQVMHKVNAGETPDRKIRFSPFDFMVFSNRSTSGRDYMAFCDSMDRLMGTVIKTNITSGGADDEGAFPHDEEGTGFFHLVESAHIRRKNDSPNGRILWAEIEISEWILNGIKRKQVLTLHRDYFRLRKPIERRVYEIARKLCGRKEEFAIGLRKLLNRTGAQTNLRRFRHTIREMAEGDHLPDYHIDYVEEGDKVVFRNRGTMLDTPVIIEGTATAVLSSDAYERAREAAPGWDVRLIEQEWRSWMNEGGMDAPRDPDKAYLGFCRKWFEKRGYPA